MIAIEESRSVAAPLELRPLDVTRDLYQVADLIELCFASTMDPDGQEYLRQMRRTARDMTYMRWASQLAEAASPPVSGFVWEENGRIIGNLSLVAMWKGGRRMYLIANVAVHPIDRRKGIARSLTEAALRYAQDRGAASAWLQVREENDSAVNLYRNLGFEERARRSTWNSTVRASEVLARLNGQANLQSITPRYTLDWSEQQAWLARTYPADVAWNLPLRLSSLGPGLFDNLSRFFSGERIQHWAARDNEQLSGVLTWQRARGYTDLLWLALHPDQGEDTALSLLSHARRVLPPNRLLSLNYPADACAQAFESAGFTVHQTLIWMEAVFLKRINVWS